MADLLIFEPGRRAQRSRRYTWCDLRNVRYFTVVSIATSGPPVIAAATPGKAATLLILVCLTSRPDFLWGRNTFNSNADAFMGALTSGICTFVGQDSLQLEDNVAKSPYLRQQTWTQNYY